MASQIELIVRARDQASKTLQQIGQGLRNQSQSYRQLGQSHTQYANQTSRYARQQLSYGQATLRQTVQQRSEVQRLGQTYQRMGSQATQSAQQQARATKEARQQEIKLAPQLAQVVFQGRSCQTQAVPCVDLLNCTVCHGIRVLNNLGFIQNQHMEFMFDQMVFVTRQ